MWGGGFFLFEVFVTTPPVENSYATSMIDVLLFLGLKLMMHTTDKIQNPVGGK